MILSLIDEAVDAGSSQEAACEQAGVSQRSVQRWRSKPQGDDGRHGPKTRPANAFTEAEKARVLKVVNSPEFKDLSPKQIVPKLADRGEYEGSESTMYRIMREAGQLAHRGRAKAPSKRTVKEHVATAPNQVWSWDITYLHGPARGTFFYLYMFVDVWSRKIVGWEVCASESPELAAALMLSICVATGVDPKGLVVHSDNGGPMKGSTMLATLQSLGIVPSFSRPSVSDDNPFSEALFRTLKYDPSYPSKPFETIEAAQAWVRHFVAWYNGEHQHSSIRFVTPEERHSGREIAVLQQRREVYERARRRHPERWCGPTRNWTAVGAVYLNPEKKEAGPEVEVPGRSPSRTNPLQPERSGGQGAFCLARNRACKGARGKWSLTPEERRLSGAA